VGVYPTSKESWPRGSGFDFTPEEWCLPSDNPWNNGMMEEWNSEYSGSKADDGLILFPVQRHL
jgi:hypothetical protein